MFWFSFVEVDAPNDVGMYIAEDGGVVVDVAMGTASYDILYFGRITRRTVDERGARWRVRFDAAVSRVTYPHPTLRDEHKELDMELDLVLQTDGTLLEVPVKDTEWKMSRWRLGGVNRQLSRLALKHTFRYHVVDSVRDAR